MILIYDLYSNIFGVCTSSAVQIGNDANTMILNCKSFSIHLKKDED